MSSDDFDISALARYLHLTPQQVERLANRGKVPGRKVAGQWRFSRAEIHHWMEERIGLLDDMELAKVEGELRRQAERSADGDIRIRDLLRPETIAAPLAARTRRSVIVSITNLAADAGLLWDPRKMAESVQTREEMQTTALDNGVALLHPRRPMPSILAEGFLALGVTTQGIPFGGGQLTDIFFLLGSIDDRSHLRTLARISRLITNGELLDEIRQAVDANSVFALLTSAEDALPAGTS